MMTDAFVSPKKPAQQRLIAGPPLSDERLLQCQIKHQLT